MTLKVHSFCLYPGTGVGLPSDAHWAARWFVRAIKDHEVRKPPNADHHRVPSFDGKLEFKLEAKTRGHAAAWFAEQFVHAAFLKTDGARTIVPIPGHECDSAAKVLASPIGRLAAMICALRANWICEPLLWLKAPVESARSGGPRQAVDVFPHLQLGKSKYPDRKIVLLDDVKTSGGHLMAAEACIRLGGYKVSSAICVARTVEDMSGEAFSMLSEDLPLFDP